ncbi:MAG: formate hydrogenlyase [Halothiobacillus sp. 14-56-357]|nr:MAG: formate hydrogenlyase [Halothiobacillus sp. 15-55-196]OZB56555.1 MAG: formate hydrogenlyase [Halothiobacillus sp. 14-56-357]OZB75991.1 MAG: formate hydrogenlyase [Halothiobacillus sp. 13-55-115]
MVGGMTMSAWVFTLIQALLYLALAPLLAGWIQKVKARLQNRRGASIWQPYRNLYKLFAKEARMAHTASPVFRAAPYIVFAAIWLAASAIPLLTTDLPTAAMADVIVIAGLLGLSRFFLALAGMDVGTAFGGMGASREVFISALAEPAMLMAVFTLAMTAHTTNLATAVGDLLVSAPFLRPSFLFALIAVVLVVIAETGRIPVDNPSTHLELTMIHEALILEYSGRQLALLEWAAQLKLLLFATLLVNVFLPWGTAQSIHPNAIGIAFVLFVVKIALLGVALAVSETLLAKMRIFRIPVFLNMALLMAFLGLMSHVILEVGA